MSQQLESPAVVPPVSPAPAPVASAEPAQPPQPTQRDLQRSALRDLVELATQCAATEAEIEHQQETAQEEENKSFEKAAKNLGYRYSAQQEALKRKHEERLTQLASQYESDQAAAKEAREVARRREEQEFESIQQDIQQKVEKAVWLADSMLEGTQNQVRSEQRKAQNELQAHLELLEAQERQAQDLLRTYHHAPLQEMGSVEEEEKVEGDINAIFAERRTLVEFRLDHLKKLRLPRMFVGVWPILMGLVVFAAAVGIGQLAAGAWQGGQLQLNSQALLMSLGVAAGVTIVGGVVLWFLAQNQVRAAYIPLAHAIQSARAAAKARLRETLQIQDHRHSQATRERNDEVQQTKEKFAPALARANRAHETSLTTMRAEFDKQLSRLAGQRDRAQAEADDWKARHLTDLESRYQQELGALTQEHEQRLTEIRRQYDDAQTALQRRLKDGLQQIQAPIEQAESDGQLTVKDWEATDWAHWRPPASFAQSVRFGDLEVDLRKIAESVPKSSPAQLPLPGTFTMPASVGFPRQASLLLQSDRELREEAMRAMQMVMTRLLTGLPPGRVRFTILDPVGLGQNFAGFMHLADHDEALIGGRIWTENEHIERRLMDLTEHMETVIQKYLRNEFETIDDYNAQAGELAEPYRFLVIADFPVGFSTDAFRRLASIAASGSRCGVYTLIYRDTRQSMSSDMDMEVLEAHSVNLVQQDGRFVWKDKVFQQFPLKLDAPPSEETLTTILDVVGKQAKEAKRVEVPFDTIAPTAKQFWSASAASDLTVPVGRLGATRLQTLRLGRGVAQHALVAGKTGSGKSTLLHVLITNLAMWYAPDEVEFYLVDFKKGVEFKTYATHVLPHARAIAVESDREFGLSVLHRLDAELARRGELFRRAGVQDLPSYRQVSGVPKMQRTLLIIDEFQEFFSEDDKLAQDAAILLDRLVRQGRAFGIHVLLGSQTIGGTSGLARSTIGQMAVRIALQCSEADSQLILGDNNSAARLLSRPGEAIYNDAGGLVEANSPFQVSWLPDEQREVYLQEVQRRYAATGQQTVVEPIVFEGNAPAEIRKNARLAMLLSSPRPTEMPVAPQAFLGEPVAIKEPTAVTFRRQGGASLLVVGQQEESAMAVMAMSMVSLAVQQPDDKAQFWVFDGSPADSILATVFPQMQKVLPHKVHLIEWRKAGDAINDLAEELARRQASEEHSSPAIYVLIYGLQRYRILRRQEDTFSFGAGDEEKKPQPDKQFATLLREGPGLGIHILTWCDTPASVDRVLDRNSMREFDNRVLFQMSATDSSNLIDSPAANKLGFYRALSYSEEQGVMEKFRPYALPDAEFLKQVKEQLAKTK